MEILLREKKVSAFDTDTVSLDCWEQAEGGEKEGPPGELELGPGNGTREPLVQRAMPLGDGGWRFENSGRAARSGLWQGH